MHCHRFITPPRTRRDMLLACANGFGAVALAALWSEDGLAAPHPGPFAPKEPHFSPRARNVIFLFMDGGPSQVDTFDPKPRLAREHGQPIKLKVPPTQFNNVGTVMQSPWAFRQYGESGIPVSDLFPHVAQCVDELAVVRSMTSNFSEHTSANYFLHSGSGQQGRPSMGAWAAYGLGSECHELPGFVVLDSGMIPPGGLDCFGSGFLPAAYQGSLLRRGAEPVADLVRSEPAPELQQNKLRLLAQLDSRLQHRHGSDDALEAAIANYELACRMQTAVPELADLSRETHATRRLYGLDDPATEVFGSQCPAFIKMDVSRQPVGDVQGIKNIECFEYAVGNPRIFPAVGNIILSFAVAVLHINIINRTDIFEIALKSSFADHKIVRLNIRFDFKVMQNFIETGRGVTKLFNDQIIPCNGFPF